MSFVLLDRGRWAVMITDNGQGLYFPDWSIRERAEMLATEHVRGFDRRPHQVSVARVDRVMPKTFVGAFFYERMGDYGRTSKRLPRADVIACAQSLDAAKALRDKLARVGREADAQIERDLSTSPEVARLRAALDTVEADIRNGVRASALATIKASLPEIFGACA